MMGSFVTRVLILTFGYAYPAYECYKTLERNKPAIEQLRFWCQYWILVAVLTVSERFGDAFVSWLPMYSEAKLAFFVYLWYPKTRGTTYVYETFFRPYVAKHEVEIDRNLLELRAKAGDAVFFYWQKAATFGQTKFFELLQYAALISQSSKSRRNPAQEQQQQQNNTQPPSLVPTSKPTLQQETSKDQTVQQMQQSSLRQIPNKSSSASVQAETPSSPAKGLPSSSPVEAAPSPTKSPSRSLPKEEVSSPSKNQSRGATLIPLTHSSSTSSISEDKFQLSEATSGPSSMDDSDLPRDETLMDETIQAVRGRLRNTRAGAAPAATTALRRR